VVHIATLPAIAQLWLSPRLPALRAAAPDISISITAMEDPPNLKRAPYDLCLFFGQGAGQLAEDVIFPVCSRAVAEKLRGVGDLALVPCLSDATWAQDWEAWLAVAAPGLGISPRGPVFSLYALAVEEAVNGGGVLMGHQALVARQLAAGALVAPFDARVMLPRGLRLWAARPVVRGSAVEEVQRWLRRA
jgi:LysR family glycine cleavage system transcriptional activator